MMLIGRPLSEDTIKIVQQFYNDDQGTTLMPGMKDFVSVKNDKNERVHIQKRLILSNLKEFFVEFRQEHPNNIVGFSTFASLRPKHCVLAGGSGTHTICVCPIQQNVKVMMLGNYYTNHSHFSRSSDTTTSIIFSFNRSKFEGFIGRITAAYKSL